MNNLERKEIEEAIDAANDALYHLNGARSYLNSAGNWGLLDIFGGNLLTGLFKHSKMQKAEYEIQEAKYALQKFSRELRDVSGYSSIHIDDFLTFADFFFDGLIADLFVQSKISDAKRQVDEAIYRVEGIRRELMGKLS
jgi:hypothetical protein